MADPNMKGRKITRTRAYDPVSGRSWQQSAVYSSQGALLPGYPKQFRAPYAWSGSQYTESEGHPFLSSKRKGMADIGGEFFTTKKYIQANEDGSFTGSRPSGAGGTSYWTYKGPILAVNPRGAGFGVDYSVAPANSNTVELDALGATAIARINPTNPVVDLLAALGELRKEGLPSLPGAQSNWRERTQAARNAGSEYLNAQFGWFPLVSEMSAFGSTITRANAVIEQYRRGIGRPTRRGYDFPIERFTKSEVLGSLRRPYIPDTSQNQWLNADGVVTKETDVLRSRWFKGCFTYYFPSNILGSKKLADLAILANQLGLEPSPEVVWNLSPWSWAADWFTNSGDVIANWSRFNQDGLVMRYGYMMEHTIIRTTYTMHGATSLYRGVLAVSPVTFVSETKVRVKANPYGFGVSWEGLSPFKASILAALGISRV